MNVPPYALVGPCSTIPDRIAPIACSRIPKCRVRPYGVAFQWAVFAAAGPNESTPFIVVLFDSARSADPPHSSGNTGARAVSTAPDAARVETPFGSTGQDGNASVQPSGSSRACSRSNNAFCSGFAAAHPIDDFFPLAFRPDP